MAVTSVILGDELLVTVDGPFDGSLAPDVHRVVDDAIERGTSLVVVDLAAVPAFDEGAVAVLAAACDRLWRAGGRLVVHLPGGRMVDIPRPGDVRDALTG